MKVLPASVFAFLVTIALVGAPAFAAPASQSEPIVLAEWGDNYGGTPKGSGEGGGYGGSQSGGSGGWQQQKPKQNDSDYAPSKKPDGYEGGSYEPKQKPSGYDDGNFQPKQKGGYGGGGQQGGPANNDDECIGHAGTQFPEHCRGAEDGGGTEQGNSGDVAACRTQCDKKCKDDFVPGSDKQKSCSLRCSRACRG
jgi:hypothetical protein